MGYSRDLFLKVLSFLTISNTQGLVYFLLFQYFLYVKKHNPLFLKSLSMLQA